MLLERTASSRVEALARRAHPPRASNLICTPSSGSIPKERGVVYALSAARDPSGRRRWVTCETKREAEKVLAEKLREAGHPTKAAVDPNVTIAQYGDRWLALRENSLKPTTLKSYAEKLRLHIVPRFGRIKLRLLSRGHIKTFLTDKQSDSLSRNTVRLIHATLRAIAELGHRRRRHLSQPSQKEQRA